MRENHLVIVTNNLTGIPGEGEGEFYLDGVRLALTAISFEIRAGEMVKAKMELDCRVSTREPGGPPIYAVPFPPAGTDFREAAEIAWGIIANAHGGDWEKATPEWKAAAERWRDKYLPGINRARPVGEVIPMERVRIDEGVAIINEPPELKAEKEAAQKESSYALFYWVAHPLTVDGLNDCVKVTDDVYRYRGRKLVTDAREQTGETVRLCRGPATPGPYVEREFCQFYWIMRKAELDRLTDESLTVAKAGPDGRHRWHWNGHPVCVDDRVLGTAKVQCIWPPPVDPGGLHAFLFPEDSLLFPEDEK
jgi:hypothetical protein